MNEKNFHFQPETQEAVQSAEEATIKESLEQKPKKHPEFTLTIVGSKENSKEQNQREFAQAISERLVTAIENANKDNKKLVLDLATGRSPKAIWPVFRELVDRRSIDLSNLIIMGHEEAWGSYPVDDLENSSNFDGQRKNFLLQNNIEVKEITDPEQADQETLEGNFVPMHLVKTEDYIDSNSTPEELLATEEKAASESAKKYQSILDTLRSRPDVTSFGLYGVGTDGHIAELQVSGMGLHSSLKQRKAYTEPIEYYSYERGLYPWSRENPTTNESELYEEPEFNNIFWGRSVAQGQDRSTWQGFEGISRMVGLGWRDILKEENMVFIFNNETKKVAIELALDGSLTGELGSQEGEESFEIKKQKGEGEAIVPELQGMVGQWQEIQMLTQEAVDQLQEKIARNKGAGLLVANCYFETFHKALDKLEASPNYPEYEDRYRELWRMANRYVGRRAPISRAIEMRYLFGKKTELVVAPEAIVGTKYESLVNN